MTSTKASARARVPDWLSQYDSADAADSWASVPDVWAGCCCPRATSCRKDGRLRDVALRIVLSRWYQIILLALTVASAAVFLLYEPLEPPTTPRNRATTDSSIPFGLAFTVDVVLQMVAFGLTGGGSFFTSPWRVLDLISTLFVWLDLLPSFANASSLRMLRLMRVLTMLPQTAVVLEAMLAAGPALATIGLLVTVTCSAFALLAVQLWSGLLSANCGYDAAALDGGSLLGLPSNSSGGGSSSLASWVGFDIPCGLPCSAQGSDGCIYNRGDACPSEMPVVFPAAAPVNATFVALSCRRTVNPGYGQQSFDNFGAALLTSFWMYTTEGWSNIAVRTARAFGLHVAVLALFTVHVYAGSYLLL